MYQLPYFFKNIFTRSVVSAFIDQLSGTTSPLSPQSTDMSATAAMSTDVEQESASVPAGEFLGIYIEGQTAEYYKMVISCNLSKAI